MADDGPSRELAYYKRHLDGLAAQRISIEHHQWMLHMQLRQKKQGFQLLSKLALSFGAHSEPASMFRVAALAINSALEMDRTVIFVPAGPGGRYAPAHLAGAPEEHVERITKTSFEFPEDLVGSSGLLLVNRSTATTPLVSRLRDVIGVDTFICVPVMGHGETLGIILSGRIGGHPSLFRALDHGDVDTFRAISGILQAVTQNTRLAILEQTERLKTEFFADVAHEFRTPLTLTLGPLAQILTGKWGPVAPQVRERLEVVERNQERLLGLINQILDLAKLESSAAELRPEPILDVNALVAECASHFETAAEARGLDLRSALDPALGAFPLLADREKLERALFNLLSNALKFTDRGHIEVSTRVDGASFEIAVSDTGIGISEADLATVFDRFRRVRASEPHGVTGSGIGLALVKRIAELHAGRIVAESAKGVGSRFTLTLPLLAAPDSSQHPLPRPEPELPPLRPQRRMSDEATPAVVAENVEALNRETEASFDATKSIVLYVEDDADLRIHVRDSLSDCCNVFLATDGVDGLEKARRYFPDAIISDQRMPRMSGRAFLAALRDDPTLRCIPMVLLTAQHGMEARVESLGAGADDYITKPFQEAELRARISNLIRARCQERELAELNRRLRLEVREQMTELARTGELEQFLPRPLVESIRANGSRASPATRKHVTVLVAELSALAAFGDRVDEPNAVTMVDDWMGTIATICGARGGIIDGFTGGRISVVFGANSDGTPAEAAWAGVQTAVEMREKMRKMNADARRRGLSLCELGGLGLGSGACMVGAFGTSTLRTYTALGTSTLTAARLCATASPDALLCDDATRSLLGDRIRARSLAEPSGFHASKTDAAHHEVIAVVLGPDAPVPLPVPAARPSREASDGRIFRREGEYWTVVYSRRVFRLKHSKGTTYLGRLLSQPHVDIHVVELAMSDGVSPPEGPRVSVSEALALGLRPVAAEGVSPVLDARAKQQYRERLEDLDEQIECATRAGDCERVAHLEGEKTELARALAGAVGLSGRDRNLASTAERFRVNLTRTLKAVLQRIRQEHPELGRHLATSIRTGAFFSYSPNPDIPGGWDVSF